MAKDSKIQWTDHTWNIARGCSKVDADCKYCYMFRQSLDETRYKPDQVIKTKTVFNMPLKIKEPARIFVSSLTDVFHPDCDSFRNEMWDIIRKCPQHTFQILTKRPERITNHLPEDWGEGWDNVWLGTSVGSNAGLHRIYQLCKVTSKVRFLSLEPLHGEVNLDNVKSPVDGVKIPVLTLTEDIYPSDGFVGPIHWVIVGGESGNDKGKYRYRPCEIKWIETIIHDCTISKVPVFVKQLGTYLAKTLKLKDRHGGNIDEWPDHLRIRQFPMTQNDIAMHRKETGLSLEDITLYSSFEQVLGTNSKTYSEEERKVRWEKIMSFDGDMKEHWADTSDCAGCCNLDEKTSWCNLMGLPCTVNPVLTYKDAMIGMACMGLGYNGQQKLEF